MRASSTKLRACVYLVDLSCVDAGVAVAHEVDVTVLGLVGGAPGGETPRVADSSAAGAGRFFHNSVPPSKLNRLGKHDMYCTC